MRNSALPLFALFPATCNTGSTIGKVSGEMGQKMHSHPFPKRSQ